MQSRLPLDIDVRCIQCGAERPYPEGEATRVLEGDAVYVDVTTQCECGASRVRINVAIGE